MDRDHNSSRLLAVCVSALLILAWAADARAQQIPPRAFHYQGRLTDSTGSPLHSAQPVWFSLHAGGDAATSDSGTLLYREMASITSDLDGVFQHLIGTDATVEAGGIDPADFNTTQPIYLQVAIGDRARIILPRTRLSSVGFAFQAANATGDITPRSVSIQGYGTVIDDAGRWVGAPVDTPGPRVTSIEDATGGRTVPGDLIRITGAGLDSARVKIGGLDAPIKSRIAGEIVCQVPAGLPIGAREITVSSGTTARLAGMIEMSRYLVAISTAADSIWILDPHELDFDRTPVVTRIPLPFGTEANRVQTAFAHNGALLLVPDNQSDRVFAIDMTRNPPAPIDPAGFAVANTAKAVAVETSPDGDIMLVADHGSNLFKAVNITQPFPPYTSQSALLSNETDPAYWPPAPPAGIAPCAMRFVGSELLVVVSNGLNKTIAYHRRLAPGSAEGDRRRFYIDTPPDSSLFTMFTIPTGAQELVVLPDRTRILVGASGTIHIAACWLTDMWTSDGTDLGVTAEIGPGFLQSAISPDGRTVFAVTDPGNSAANRLHVMSLEGNHVRRIGALPGPGSWRIVSLEPIVGELAAIAADGSIYFYKRHGAALERLNFEGPLVEGKLDMGDEFQSINTVCWQP